MNYILDEIPRGQLNNVILTTMLDGDKYGYEIIEEISKWSNGKIELKQPSLYSALKRLESSEMLSSYWTESELGGNRHYYRLTDLGKKTASAWADNFMKQKETPSVVLNSSPVQEKKETQPNEQNFTILDQGNIFNLLKEDKKEQPAQANVEENKIDELQYNLFDKIPVQEPVKEEKIQRAARIANLNSKSQLVQLKQFTEADRKSEFEKLKQNNANKFFKSEKNEQKVEKKEDYCFINEKIENNLPKNEEIKQEIEAVKDEKQEEKVESTFNISKYASARDGYFLAPEKEVETNQEEKAPENKPEEIFYKNDGVFLSEYETATELPKVKKIEPMNLNIEIPSPNENITFKNSRSENMFNSPRKDVQEERSSAPQTQRRISQRPSFSSYMGLKNYYNHLGIQFDEYKQVDKSQELDKKHIWLVNAFRCSIFLIVSIILSLALNFGIKTELYGRIAFIVIPCVILLIGLSYLAFYFYESKHPKSKLPVLNITSTLHCIITSVCLILVSIAINLMLGFNGFTGITYLPTLIYPIILLALISFSVQLNKLIELILKKISNKKLSN